MSNPTTKVRAAVVGLGWPGMQHLKGYTADPRSEVIAINSFDEEVKHFVECIVDSKEPISSAEQGIMLMQMLDGIYESSEKGRSVPIADLSTATG